MAAQVMGGGTPAVAGVLGTVVTAGGGVAGGVAAPVVLGRQLARTGASSTSVLLAIAVVLLVVGALLVGLYRRHADAGAPART